MRKIAGTAVMTSAATIAMLGSTPVLAQQDRVVLIIGQMAPPVAVRGYRMTAKLSCPTAR